MNIYSKELWKPLVSVDLSHAATLDPQRLITTKVSYHQLSAILLSLVLYYPQVELVPAVQRALNIAFRERYGSTPCHVRFGRAPRTALSTLAFSTGQDWQVDVLDDKALRKKLQSLVEVQSQLHKVLDEVQANRGKQRAAASRNKLPKYSVGENVRFWRSGSTPKLLMMWTGPWRVVVAQRPHVYGVQNIVSSSRRPCCSDAFLCGCRSGVHSRAE